MVLIPLASAQLPSSVVSVSGPGPVESHSSTLIDEAPPPPPPASEKRSPNPQTDESKAEESPDGDAGSDQETEPASASDDPYANLGGAFGNYLADQPRPLGAIARNDLDDLLL